MSHPFYLGLDIGSKRIGLAVGSVISPVSGRGYIDVVREDWHARIAQVIKRDEVAGFVVGIPYVSSGDVTSSRALAEEWITHLHQTFGLPVATVNEAYSSVQAEQQLRNEGVDTSLHKGAIDERAAILLLEQWLHAE